MAERIFISHASEDEAVVGRIVAYLEAQGVPCWIAARDIPPRSIYAEEIARGVQECSACAVIISAASNQSKAVKREVELASHYDKPFIPIRIDATEPGPGLSYYLQNTQWLDYRREGEHALARIAASASVLEFSISPARRRHTFTPAAVLVVGALAVTAIGGWFALSRLDRGAAIASAQGKSAVAPLQAAIRSAAEINCLGAARQTDEGRTNRQGVPERNQVRVVLRTPWSDRTTGRRRIFGLESRSATTLGPRSRI